MRYHNSRIFEKFNKMSERLKSSSSLLNLGKATNVEVRLFNAYCRGVRSLNSRFYFYKSIISGDIKYNASMGTKNDCKERAISALKECHIQAVKIKNKLSKLVLVEIPERYSNDFESLMYFNERSKEAQIINDSFMKNFCDIIVSQKDAFEENEYSVVSDCEILGFCVCRLGNVPYIDGCIRSSVDLLNEYEFMKKFKEASVAYAEWLGKTYRPQAE